MSSTAIYKQKKLLACKHYFLPSLLFTEPNFASYKISTLSRFITFIFGFITKIAMLLQSWSQSQVHGFSVCSHILACSQMLSLYLICILTGYSILGYTSYFFALDNMISEVTLIFFFLCKEEHFGPSMPKDSLFLKYRFFKKLNTQINK